VTPSQLKAKYEQNNPGSPFFSRAAMKFFGDSMANFGVLDHEDCGCYELIRRRPVENGLSSSHFFHRKTFERGTKESFLISLINENSVDNTLKIKNFYNLFAFKSGWKKWDTNTLERALSTAKDAGNKEIVTFFEEKLEPRQDSSEIIASFNAQNLSTSTDQTLKP